MSFPTTDEDGGSKAYQERASTADSDILGPHNMTSSRFNDARVVPEEKGSSKNRDVTPEAELTGSKRDKTPNEINCLRALAFFQMDYRLRDARLMAYPGTCEWIFDHGAFRIWLVSRSRILWIRGGKGVGKSTLLKHIFTHFERAKEIAGSEPSKLDDLKLNFFFDGRGVELQKTTTGFYRSLLHQLLNMAPNLLPDLVEELAGNGNRGLGYGTNQQWSNRELRELTRTSLIKVSRGASVWIFIDAIDEGGEDTVTQVVKDINLWVWDSELTAIGGSLHILLASHCHPFTRPKFMLHDFVEMKNRVLVDMENNGDIEKYATERLETFGVHDDDLIAMIVRKAHGVFLWVALTLENLENLRPKEHITRNVFKREVERTPESLENVYRERLLEIKEEDKKQSLRVFYWVLCAREPLNLDMLRFVSVVHPRSYFRSISHCQESPEYVEGDDDFERSIRYLSHGLVEVSQVNAQPEYDLPQVNSKETFQFIHASVRDFFLLRGLKLLDATLETNKMALSAANEYLSRSCMKFIALQDDLSNFSGREEMRTEFQKFDLGRRVLPLLEYALRHWCHHEEAAEMSGHYHLVELLKYPSSYIMDVTARLGASWHVPSGDCWTKGYTLAHLASSRGWIIPLLYILTHRDMKTAKEGHKVEREQNSPHLASKNGTDGLLNSSADRSEDRINSADELGRTPLWCAARYGRTRVVASLLDRKELDIASADCFGGTPLMVAAKHGHEEVLKLLLEHKDVDINQKDREGRTGLTYAAASRDASISDIVKLFTQHHDINVDAKDATGRTPLSWVGHPERMKDSGYWTDSEEFKDSDPKTEEFKDYWNRIPDFVPKITNEHLKAVKYLAERNDVETDSQDHQHRTPLSWAAGNGHLEFMMYLAVRGDVEADSRDNQYRTPLSWAAQEGWSNIVEYLAERDDVDADSRDYWKRTPLSYAAMYGHLEIVEYLADRKEVTTDSTASFGRTPLSIAAGHDCGHLSVVAYLSRRFDVNINSRDRAGRTPLSWAASREDGPEITRALLDLESLEMSKDALGWTPLMHAADEGHPEIVNTLTRDSRVKVDAGDKLGYTALMLVLKEEDMMQRLQKFQILAPLSNLDQDLKEQIQTAISLDDIEQRRFNMRSIAQERNKRKRRLLHTKIVQNATRTGDRLVEASRLVEWTAILAKAVFLVLELARYIRNRVKTLRTQEEGYDPQKKRFNWQCECGQKFSFYVREDESQSGAARRLETLLNRRMERLNASNTNPRSVFNHFKLLLPPRLRNALWGHPSGLPTTQPALASDTNLPTQDIQMQSEPPENPKFLHVGVKTGFYIWAPTLENFETSSVKTDEQLVRKLNNSCQVKKDQKRSWMPEDIQNRL